MSTTKESKEFESFWNRTYPDLPFKLRSHFNIRSHKWTLMKFKKDEFDESVSRNIIYGKNGNLVLQLEKLQSEIISDSINKRKTTIHPIHRTTSKYARNPLKNIIEKFNILLLVGLEESSRRDTKDSPAGTTGVNHLGWGTDGTAESESQTGLIVATGARQVLDTDGQRSTISQTSKYGMTTDDTDLTVPVTLKEAVLFNALTGGIAHARIQFPDFLLSAGERVTAQINELFQNL